MDSGKDPVERQEEIEVELIRGSEARYYARLEKGTEQKNLSLSKPAQKIISGYSGTLGDSIRGWIDRSKERPVQWAQGANLLWDEDPYVLALITLRTLMDYCAREDVTLVSLAVNVASAVDLERRLRLMQEQEAGLYAAFIGKTLKNGFMMA